MFLHALADRLVVFQTGGVSLFEGGYQQFLDKEGWREEQNENSSSCGVEALAHTGKLSKKDNRKMRSEIITQKGRKLKPIEVKIEKTEAGIEAREHKLNRLNQELVEASRVKDGGQIAVLSKDIHQYQLEVDRLFAELEKLYDDKEQIESYYEERLKDLQALV
jgi:ATP-binding cassette subfamily F protein 3